MNFCRQDNSTVIVAKIVNDQNISLDAFLDKIYNSILPKLSKLPENYKLDAEMALAMFIFRGSVDFNRGLYAVDIKTPTQKYIDNIFKLLLSSDELLSRLNLNFRELQPQYTSNERKRNTQIRINLKWFYDNVMSIPSFQLNDYKTAILTQNLRSLGDTRSFNSFEERLIFYKQSVLGRSLTQYNVDLLRADLEFTKHEIESKPDNRLNLRNQKIVSFARETFDDVCVGCADRYSIEDRSFKMPRNGRYYFEINHVIPFANDSETVDVLDNLVKLCPTCHRALTPGRAYDSLQKELIKKMIDSRSEVKRFVLSMTPSNYMLSPVDYVFSMLK